MAGNTSDLYEPSQQPIDAYARGFQTIFPGPSQKLAFNGTSEQSAAFQANKGLNNLVLRLFASEDCWIVFGDNPTADPDDGDSFFCPGGIIQWMGVTPGADKLAVIQDSNPGFLHIIEGA